ncbi:sensor histidine kinase [Ornithinimicrobium avium]|uniref:histidine kinase n=1 Tax=Ornithinimicrobium avium TaxID=2283195 RepID=A0A345NQV4_9MICO|nr:histidine kinase [Ornithinimicrobium avium]AXH97412.1 hypothetical protein DV701_16005 [Ornithinimicrobium avium]
MARRERLVDGALALALAVLGVMEVLSAHGLVGGVVADPEAPVGPLWLDLSFAALVTLPAAWRRLWPVAVPLAVLGVHVIANVTTVHHLPFFGALLTLGVLAYTFGRYAPHAWARWGWLGPLAFAGTVWVHLPGAQNAASILYVTFLLTAPWVAGRVIRRLDLQRSELESALHHVSVLEEQRREAALLTERARIAREMHDVLAHGVSVMVVQTGAARLDLPQDSHVREALLSVEQTGRRVLDELRRTVGLLRAPDTGDAITPSARLRDLPGLVDSMRDAGLDVELDIRDVERHDVARELVVYHVVREALTNSLRHAGRTTTRVTVTGGEALQVTVRDAGGRPAQRVEGAGYGLTGLRERVALYGGTLRAGRCGEGFEVVAVIPWEEQP